MNQSQYMVARCTCGHEWQPQKDPDDMSDGPRCSECGAIGNDITVERQVSENENKNDTTASSIIESVERQASQEDLIARIETNIDQIEDTTPTAETVSDELQPIYRRLKVLREEISMSKTVSMSELEAIEGFVEDLKEELNDVPELDEITDLEHRINSLENKKHQLESEIETAKQRLERLEKDFQQLWGLWKHAQSNAKVYRQGLHDGYVFARQNPDAQAHDMIGRIEWPFTEQSKQTTETEL